MGLVCIQNSSLLVYSKSQKVSASYCSPFQHSRGKKQPVGGFRPPPPPACLGLKINLNGEKDKPDVKPKGEGIVKTKPDVKQKKEPDVKSNIDVKCNIELKHDVMMIRTKPDMNKITYEEEKIALILGTTDVFTVW